MREDAVQVAVEMLEDLQAYLHGWENAALVGFLEALAPSVEGIVDVYANEGRQLPDQPNLRRSELPSWHQQRVSDRLLHAMTLAA